MALQISHNWRQRVYSFSLPFRELNLGKWKSAMYSQFVLVKTRDKLDSTAIQCVQGHSKGGIPHLIVQVCPTNLTSHDGIYALVTSRQR